MTLDPPDRALKRFETVELDPDAFCHRGSFDEFDPAANWRSVERAYSKRVQA